MLFGLLDLSWKNGKKKSLSKSTKEAHLPMCNQNKKRHWFPRSLSTILGSKKIQGRTFTQWRELQCCVRVCSPVDMCSPLPSGHETWNLLTYLYNQVFFFAFSSRWVRGFEVKLGFLQLFFCFGQQPCRSRSLCNSGANRNTTGEHSGRTSWKVSISTVSTCWIPHWGYSVVDVHYGCRRWSRSPGGELAPLKLLVHTSVIHAGLHLVTL